MRILLLLTLTLLPAPLLAQAEDAYHDPVAEALVARARAARSELGRSITSYSAIVRSRAAARLRMPLKDRTLAREETAARVRWSRDGASVVQMIAGRSQELDQVESVHGTDLGQLFDPASDRIYFGFNAAGMAAGNRDMWIAHPLGRGAEDEYRYRSGDTLSLRLPDGRSVLAIQLQVSPRRPSWHYLDALLWIEPESGALVQAAYRPARTLDVERDTAFIEPEAIEHMGKVPGLLKPIEAAVDLVLIEYQLWDFRHWLPRLMRVEGYARAGMLKMPVAAELAYQILDVTDEDDGAEEPSPEEVLVGWGATGEVVGRTQTRDGRVVHVFRPEDPRELLESAELPPPIWKDAPQFATQGDIEELIALIEGMVPPENRQRPVAWKVLWGLGDPGLVRYNRVEGLSMAARVRAEHPLASGHATVRLGTADLHPNVELGVARPGLRRALSLDLYHKLASVDRGASFGLGSSTTALFFGRDDGEYYRTTGLRLAARPGEVRQAWRVELFAERQRAVERETDWSVPRLFDGDGGFRPVLAADAAELAGASVALSPWWGTDPMGAQAGLELFVEGAAGSFAFGRAALTGRAALPLPGRLRLGLEAAGGAAVGGLPAQYHWFLGGPGTLRGYPGSVAVGDAFPRGRAELALPTSFGGVVVFGDAGWAGPRAAFDPGDALLSAGAGLSVFDGLLRLDLARALVRPTGWRLDLYLDALL
ncbi:MAG TPA: hypothetical protein VMK65_05050 [Longimicrobiales bacterium]|nr:hypothetical protein [Longimicrobiales bacterium]